MLQLPLTSPVDYPRAVALAHVAEVLDELMLDREGNDPMFRLAVAVLALAGGCDLDAGDVTSISGWYGWLDICRTWIVRGLRRALDGERAFFHAMAVG